MPDVEISGIEFQISGAMDSKTPGNIRRLASALSKLKEAVSGIESDSIKKLKELSTGLKEISDAASGGFNLTKATITRISELGNVANAIPDGAADKLRDLADALDKLKAVGDFKMPNLRNLKDFAGVGNSSQQASINYPPMTYTPPTNAVVPSYGGEYSNVSEAPKGMVDMGVWETSADNIARTTAEVTLADKALGGLSTAFDNVAFAARNALKPLGNFWRSIQRIALYRLIRTALKEITQGFSEGIKNAYQWSKAGGDLGVFAGNMNSLATSTLYMKNSLGALMTSILNACIPAINTLIDGLVTVINVVNQVIAVLSGADTWNKAIKYPTSYGAAASGAADKVKELQKTILGFDEINKLNSQPNVGGSGGGGGMDYSKMFEKAEFSKWAQWMKDHLELIRGLALAIGAAFLAWKIAKHFTDDLSKIAGIAMTVGGAVLYVHGLFDAWNNGVSLDNVIEMIGGTALAAGGLALAFGKVWGAWGLIIGGVGMIITALHDVAVQGELTTESFWLLEGGILALSVGVALLTGSWIPLVIGAVAGLALAVYKNWDGIKEKTATLRTGLSNAWEGIKSAAKNAWNAVCNTVTSAVNRIKSFLGSLTLKLPEVKLPHIPMPHFEWQTNAFGITYPHFTGWWANGGFPGNKGDLFIANERGAEMVGSMNGRTAVANNQEIVSGIRQGVKEANADEVRLLREQNDLLRQLIAKDGNTTISLGAITQALQRKNQRDGGTFVPVGV